MPTDKKKPIAGMAIAIFVLGVVAATRYAAITLPADANNQAAKSTIPSTRPVLNNSAATKPVAATGKVDSVDVMVERLRARLEQYPGDVNGWVLLGRSYHYLERWDDAKAAFDKARELGYQGDTEVAVDSAMDGNPEVRGAAMGDAVFHDIGNLGVRAPGAQAASGEGEP